MMNAGVLPVLRRKSLWSLAALALFSVSTISSLGCNRPSVSQKSNAGKPADPHAEQAESLRDEVRKASDIAACRRIVDQLNNYLPQASADHRPAPMTQDQRTFLEKGLGLQPDEVGEAARSEFTTLDAYYLDEALLFRDIARSLDVSKLPPVERANAAFGWVVRNLRSLDPASPATPLAFDVSRGAATPLERAYAFLALLQQLKVDAALIGDDNGNPQGIWAVGVLVDGQILLYDARLGMPLPGPDGKGILTLAQARSNPDAFKPLAIDAKLKYDVTPERAKKSAVFVTAPLSSLSNRIRYLQQVLPEDAVQLATDLKATIERFSKAVGSAEAPPVRAWCPPAPDAYPRLLYAFLPPGEGGGDRTPPASSRIAQFYQSRIPIGVLPQFLQVLQGEPGRRVRVEFEFRSTMLSQPGQARDLMNRGRFREATELLEAVRAEARRRTKDPHELETSTREWADGARAYFAEVSRREKGRTDLNSGVNLDELRTQMENGWKSTRGPQAFIISLVAEPLAAEATYLLGQCKQEEAERLACHPETAASAKPAWVSAQRWWTSFINQYPNVRPTLQAKLNLARVLQASGQRAAAKAAYESLENSELLPLERLACKYNAESLK